MLGMITGPWAIDTVSYRHPPAPTTVSDEISLPRLGTVGQISLSSFFDSGADHTGIQVGFFNFTFVDDAGNVSSPTFPPVRSDPVEMFHSPNVTHATWDIVGEGVWAKGFVNFFFWETVR